MAAIERSRVQRCADVIIGIDPDAEKSGVAILERATRRLTLKTLAFADLLECLQYERQRATVQEKQLVVVIEAGWLNTGNWHLHYTYSIQKAAAIGRSTGMNHQTGILLTEVCKFWRLRCELQKPLVKCWKGKDRKITHDELAAFTGVTGRTNQEERDAALLAWHYAGLPVRLSVKNKEKLC